MVLTRFFLCASSPSASVGASSAADVLPSVSCDFRGRPRGRPVGARERDERDDGRDGRAGRALVSGGGVEADMSSSFAMEIGGGETEAKAEAGCCCGASDGGPARAGAWEGGTADLEDWREPGREPGRDMERGPISNEPADIPVGMLGG